MACLAPPKILLSCKYSHVLAPYTLIIANLSFFCGSSKWPIWENLYNPFTLLHEEETKKIIMKGRKSTYMYMYMVVGLSTLSLATGVCQPCCYKSSICYRNNWRAEHQSGLTQKWSVSKEHKKGLIDKWYVYTPVRTMGNPELVSKNYFWVQGG